MGQGQSRETSPVTSEIEWSKENTDKKQERKSNGKNGTKVPAADRLAVVSRSPSHHHVAENPKLPTPGQPTNVSIPPRIQDDMASLFGDDPEEHILPQALQSPVKKSQVPKRGGSKALNPKPPVIDLAIDDENLATLLNKRKVTMPTGEIKRRYDASAIPGMGAANLFKFKTEGATNPRMPVSKRSKTDRISDWLGNITSDIESGAEAFGEPLANLEKYKPANQPPRQSVRPVPERPERKTRKRPSTPVSGTPKGSRPSKKPRLSKEPEPRPAAVRKTTQARKSTPNQKKPTPTGQLGSKEEPLAISEEPEPSMKPVPPKKPVAPPVLKSIPKDKPILTEQPGSKEKPLAIDESPEPLAKPTPPKKQIATTQKSTPGDKVPTSQPKTNEGAKVISKAPELLTKPKVPKKPVVPVQQSSDASKPNPDQGSKSKSAIAQLLEAIQGPVSNQTTTPPSNVEPPKSLTTTQTTKPSQVSQPLQLSKPPQASQSSLKPQPTQAAQPTQVLKPRTSKLIQPKTTSAAEVSSDKHLDLQRGVKSQEVAGIEKQKGPISTQTIIASEIKVSTDQQSISHAKVELGDIKTTERKEVIESTRTTATSKPNLSADEQPATHEISNPREPLVAHTATEPSKSILVTAPTQSPTISYKPLYEGGNINSGGFTSTQRKVPPKAAGTLQIVPPGSKSSATNKSQGKTQSLLSVKDNETSKTACRACAKSKKWCGKELPECQSCQDRDIDCVYAQPQPAIVPSLDEDSERWWAPVESAAQENGQDALEPEGEDQRQAEFDSDAKALDPEAELQQMFHKLESERRAQKSKHRTAPVEQVDTEYKWSFTIKTTGKGRFGPKRTFADREKANEVLIKLTSDDEVAGVVTKRTTSFEGPEQLLKVDLELDNGDHIVSWVEKSMLKLSEVTNKNMLRQKQWQAVSRPKFQHYVVECELITYEARGQVPQCFDEDSSTFCYVAALHFGLSRDMWEVPQFTSEKLPLVSFTERELANEYAGKLFLEKTVIPKIFASPDGSDYGWWQMNAVPAHEKAKRVAYEPGGMYEVAFDSEDMRKVLGWDKIVIHVHAVGDVTGPVNF